MTKETIMWTHESLYLVGITSFSIQSIQIYDPVIWLNCNFHTIIINYMLIEVCVLEQKQQLQ